MDKEFLRQYMAVRKITDKEERTIKYNEVFCTSKSNDELVNEHECHLQYLNAMQIVLDKFIETIENIRDKLILSYIANEMMTQQEVAEKMGLNRSTVSKIIKKYIG